MFEKPGIIMYDLKESLLDDSLLNLQKSFEREGYLLIRSFFPLSLIQQVRHQIVEVLRQKSWGRMENDRFVAIEPVRRINSPDFHTCIECLMQEELLHELGQYPPLNWFLSALLGEPIFHHPRKMVRITYPYLMNPKDRVPPHQDFFYVKGERDTFTAWIPLGEYPPEKGGLLVAPGTHKQGLFPTQSNDEGRFGCNAIEENLKEFAWCQAHYRPGDLLLMHSLTLHQSGKNESDQFRLSLDCRFSSALGTINEEQLLPPYYPHVSDWKILSKSWKNPDRFASPSTLQIHKKEKNLLEALSTNTRFAQ
jgi:hypothetical protein